MKPSIVLVGGGGHCKAVIDVIESLDHYAIAGIVDQPEKLGQHCLGYPIIGADEELPELVKKYDRFLITVGQIKTAQIRHRLLTTLQQLGAEMATIVASSATVSRHAVIGAGSLVMPGVVIGAEVTIGQNCIINSGAIIEHESHIGDSCHIATGVVINGQTTVEQHCFIGSNSVLKQGINIGQSSVIAAGIRVLTSVATNQTVRESE